MSKFYPLVLALSCLLVGTACEPRDTSSATGNDDESRTDASTESELDSPEDSESERSGSETAKSETAKSETASPDTTEGATSTEPTSADEQEGTQDEPDTDVEQSSWRSCEDGGERAFLCDFEGGGGAAMCASDAFIELRLARPDGSQSVHRHTAGEQQSVEHCQFSSPHRSDESLTFYERGQSLMVETHYLNPKGDYAEAAGESTEGAVAVLSTDGDEQRWRCSNLAEEQMGVVESSAAVAPRENKAETCEEVVPPQNAVVRGESQQTRTVERATCGGDSAPDAFVDKAASARADIENLHFSAANITGDPNRPATYTVASYETSGESFHEPIASCADFFSRVREKDAPDTVGHPPYQVQADFWRLRYGGHVIVDGARDVCVDYCENESASVGDFIASSLDALSLVGPILSYKRSTSDAGAGGPPYHGDSWRAVDLRTMQPADFGALIDPDSALTALQHDSYIRRHETLSEAVSEAETFSVALGAMRSELEGVGPYAFHYYNSRKKLVAMRIPFREDIQRGMSPSRMSQIGIWVEPREAWIPYFEAASNAPNGGFYMTNVDLEF